jgi:hypothetical protein
MKNFITALSILSFGWVSGACAFETEWGAWQQLLLTGKLVDDRLWLVHLEQQTRIGSKANSTNMSLFRVGAGRAIFNSPWIGLIGYAYVPVFRPSLYENRLWQQLGRKWSFNETNKFQIRFRTEQRRFQRFPTWGHRGRVLVRFDHLFPKHKMRFVVWNELLINLNDVASRSNTQGTPRGIGQNRFFLGPGFDLSDQAYVEVGYLNVITNRKTPNLRQNLIWTAFNWGF